MRRNNVFLTPQLGQERFMRFVRATRVSRGSYSNASELLLSLCRVGVTGGSRDEI
jgi:hypothetical protein